MARSCQVRAYIEEPDPVVEPEPQPQAAQPETAGDPAQKAAEYLKNVLREMGLADASVDIQKEEAGAALTLSGDDIGFIIGHRGETLDALQYLASWWPTMWTAPISALPWTWATTGEAQGDLGILGQEDGGPRCEDRAQLLLGAHEPLRAAHHPHSGADRAGAKSWSEGVDQGRHVVIGPEGGERPQPRRNDRRGGRNDRNRGGRGSYNDRNRRPRNDRSRLNSAPRAEGPKSDDPNTPIYGRIEKK